MVQEHRGMEKTPQSYHDVYNDVSLSFSTPAVPATSTSTTTNPMRTVPMRATKDNDNDSVVTTLIAPSWPHQWKQYSTHSHPHKTLCPAHCPDPAHTNSIPCCCCQWWQWCHHIKAKCEAKCGWYGVQLILSFSTPAHKLVLKHTQNTVKIFCYQDRAITHTSQLTTHTLTDVRTNTSAHCDSTDPR